jgi:hypothetical protein
MVSLRCCKTYQVSFAPGAVLGWDNCEKFRDTLYKKAEESKLSSLFVEETAEGFDVEFDKEEARSIVQENPTGEFEKILATFVEQADPQNSYVRLCAF